MINGRWCAPKMCRKTANFSLSLLEPLPGAAVWAGGTFGWSATIAAVGPLEGLQVKSIALEYRLQWKEEGFWRIWTVSAAASKRFFGVCAEL